MIEFISKLEAMTFKTPHVDLTVRAINGGPRVFIGELPAPTAEEYRAEIEKARREGYDKGVKEVSRLPNDVVQYALRKQDEADKARADERERIVRELQKANPFPVSHVAIDSIIKIVRGKPPEPKPLEPLLMLMNISSADPSWPDMVKALQNTIDSLNQTRETINSLMAAVKGIQAWIAGQPT